MKEVLVLVLLGLLAISKVGMANVIRNKSLADSKLVTKSRNNEVSMYNLGNSAGLVETDKENFVYLDGLIYNETKIQEYFVLAQKEGEYITGMGNSIITPNDDLTNNLLFWLNENNVLGLSTSLDLLGETHQLDINYLVMDNPPDTQQNSYFVQGIFATRPVEMLSLGMQLGYSFGDFTSDELLINEGDVNTSLKANEITYNLFRYNFGAELVLPINKLGNISAGISFRPFDRKPFRSELEGLLGMFGELVKPFEIFYNNTMNSIFDYDLAGGYHLKQAVEIESRYVVSDIYGAYNLVLKQSGTNEIIPQGNIIAVQSKIELFKNHQLGLKLELASAELNYKREFEIEETPMASTLYIDEGKSAEITGLDFGARYYGSIAIDHQSELRIGALMNMGKDEIKQYAYEQANSGEIFNYQVLPWDVSLGLGYLPFKNLLILTELEWINSTVKIDKLVLLDENSILGDPQNKILDSVKNKRVFKLKLGTEYVFTESFVLRGGYAFERLDDEFELGNESLVSDEYLDMLKAGEKENPRLNDHSLSLGVGYTVHNITIDVFGAVHFLSLDPPEYKEEINNSGSPLQVEVQSAMNAWELGGAVKVFF